MTFKSRGKKKACEQSSQTNQHLLTPKKLYHEYKTLYVEMTIFILLIKTIAYFVSDRTKIHILQLMQIKSIKFLKNFQLLTFYGAIFLLNATHTESDF